jgi:hypothetical protein
VKIIVRLRRLDDSRVVTLERDKPLEVDDAFRYEDDIYQVKSIGEDGIANAEWSGESGKVG